MHNTILIEYPDSMPAAVNLSKEAFAAEARWAMAVKLFELGRISSGQAARLAGIGRVQFLLTCLHMGVPSVEWDDDEIQSEFQSVG